MKKFWAAPSGLAKAYVAIGLAVVAFYGAATWNGWEWGNAERNFVPADIRSSPGGYRSFHYGGGYRGGK